MISILVNGQPHEIEPGTNVTQLLDLLGHRAALCAVERNRELVPRATHAECKLAEGDEVEIVTLVGGG